MIHIVDSHAWVEYFTGSEAGLALKKLLANRGHKFITMECTVSELKSYCLRTNQNFGMVYDALKRNSIILPVMINHWLKGSEIRHEMRKNIKDFGLVDALLVAKQNELNCRVISGDSHFKSLKNIVYIARS